MHFLREEGAGGGESGMRTCATGSRIAGGTGFSQWDSAGLTLCGVAGWKWVGHCVVIPSAAEGPKKKLREKKRYNPDDIPPNFEDLQNYFIEKSSTIQEAEKFFNYYTSKGWLVGGKSKMKDWKASANNWIINTEKFNPKNSAPQPNHLHTSNQKNYDEPL